MPCEFIDIQSSTHSTRAHTLSLTPLSLDRGLGERAVGTSRHGSASGRRQSTGEPRRVEADMGSRCLSHHRGRRAPGSQRGLNKVYQ